VGFFSEFESMAAALETLAAYNTAKASDPNLTFAQYNTNLWNGMVAAKSAPATTGTSVGTTAPAAGGSTTPVLRPPMPPVTSGGSTTPVLRPPMPPVNTGGNPYFPTPIDSPGTTASPTNLTVEDLYKNILGRDGEQAGVDYWKNQFGDEIDQDEYNRFLVESRGEKANNVTNLYKDLFGRDADQPGLLYWQERVKNGDFGSMEELRAHMLGSASTHDAAANKDGAKHDYAWDESYDPLNPKLIYNPETDKWELPKDPVNVDRGSQSEGDRFTPNLNNKVTPDQTIEGRLNNVLGTDQFGNYTNPVVRQAVERAMQSFAGRGLLNSSMAQQAAQEAAIAKAIEIVGPDAERFFQQSRANQDWNNNFSRDEINFGYDKQKMALDHKFKLEQMAQQQGYTLEQMGASHGYDMEKMAGAFGFDLDKMAASFGYDLQKMMTAFGLDVDKMGVQQKYNIETIAIQAANRITEMGLDGGIRADLMKLGQSMTQINNLSSTVQSMFQSYVNQVLSISTATGMDAASKNTLIKQATDAFKAGVKLQASINGDANVDALFESIFGAD
jgi:hypothetical protein